MFYFRNALPYPPHFESYFTLCTRHYPYLSHFSRVRLLINVEVGVPRVYIHSTRFFTCASSNTFNCKGIWIREVQPQPCLSVFGDWTMFARILTIESTKLAPQHGIQQEAENQKKMTSLLLVVHRHQHPLRIPQFRFPV